MLNLLGSAASNLLVPALVVGAFVGAFGLGFYKGDVHRGTVDGAAGAKAQIEFMQRQITARDAAAKSDAEQAALDHDALTAQVEKANAIIKQIPAGGVCLTGPDVSGLRKYWNAGRGRH